MKAYLIQNHFVWPSFVSPQKVLQFYGRYTLFVNCQFPCFPLSGVLDTKCVHGGSTGLGPALHAKSRLHTRNFHNPHLNICIKRHETGRWAKATLEGLWCCIFNVRLKCMQLTFLWIFFYCLIEIQWMLMFPLSLESLCLYSLISREVIYVIGSNMSF